MPSVLVSILILIVVLQCALCRKIILRNQNLSIQDQIHKADDAEKCVNKRCATQLRQCKQDAKCNKIFNTCMDAFDENDSQALNKLDKCVRKNPLSEKLFDCFMKQCVFKAQVKLLISFKQLHDSLRAHLQQDPSLECMKQNCQTYISQCFSDQNCTVNWISCGNAINQDDPQAFDKFQTCTNKNVKAKSLLNCIRSECMKGELSFLKITNLFNTVSVSGQQ